MHIRPFFWLLLAFTCVSVLLFAATFQEHVPALMQVRVGQEHTTSAAFTLVELHLTDVQGLPIEQAHIFSHAYMTDMDMAVDQSSIKYLGEGNYRAQLRLYMAGPWAISIQAHAEGFDTLQQTLLIQVK